MMCSMYLIIEELHLNASKFSNLFFFNETVTSEFHLGLEDSITKRANKLQSILLHTHSTEKGHFNTIVVVSFIHHYS